MSVIPQTNAGEVRTESVILGRQDYISVLLRLIGMEIYKIRRRIMSKVLFSIAIVIAILVFLLFSLNTFFVLSAPPESFVPSCQPRGGPPQGQPQPNCPPPSAAQVAQFREDALRSASEPLRLPTSLNIAVQFALSAGTILIIILIGATAGGEFSIGTVRLMYTRGPTRSQFLLAKVGVAAVCAAVGILTMSIIGILTGQALNALSSIAQDFGFLSAGWIAHAMLYLLIAMLDWFIYATIAIFFAILGHSTVAGIVGALTWLFVEPIVGGILKLAGTFSQGPFGNFLKTIPDYFIENNIGALLQNQGQYIFGGSGSSLSDLHALLVLAVYLAAFIGLAWWINEHRDVTN
jgi:ABC-type transport system involved in multi-copper enzyme maturation permease subunit